MYDKVYRTDVLTHAYRCCRANGGAAGVDGQKFEDIEKYGLEQWLGELQKELKDKAYRPSAVRRVWKAQEVWPSLLAKPVARADPGRSSAAGAAASSFIRHR